MKSCENKFMFNAEKRIYPIKFCTTVSEVICFGFEGKYQFLPVTLLKESSLVKGN